MHIINSGLGSGRIFGISSINNTDPCFEKQTGKSSSNNSLNVVILYYHLICVIFVMHRKTKFLKSAHCFVGHFLEAGKMVHPSISLVTGWTKGVMKVQRNGVRIKITKWYHTIFSFVPFFPLTRVIRSSSTP